ncbi:restriction endonuclease subunit S [Candidatus Poriferisodalis sp.]|uniref:restriction endonuclease subunit S n=1 Tax=Candidatus Poriferisodalis sp. TaxID=3101277 RepID=UPI003D0EBFEA
MGEQPVRDLLDTEFAGEWGEDSLGHGLRACRVLRATNLSFNGIEYSTAAQRFVPDAKVREKRLRTGDLILEAAGGGPGVPVGRVARFAPPDEESVYLVSNFFRTLRPAPSVDSRFVYHILQDLYQQPRIWQVQQQTTGIINLNFRDYLQFRVPVPPLEEQQRIAEILDTLDEAIRATERVIVKLLDIEYGLRRDLLDGKFEGAHSEGWRHCRIGDFATVQRGASPRPIGNPAWFSSDGPGWIRISDVTAADDLLLHTRDHLSPAGVARSRYVCPGDVIMSIAATIGVAIVVGIEACYHDGFVRIDHDGSVIPEFLVMLLEHHEQGFIRSGQTGTQANINSSIVAATEVALPSLDIQSEIVAATSAVRGAIRAEKDSCRALQATRAGLAGDLLSGRVRTVAA